MDILYKGFIGFVLVLLASHSSAFEITKKDMGVCGYSKEFDKTAVNYEVDTNSILSGVITTKSIGDFVRVANGIEFDNKADIIDQDSILFTATRMLCATQVGVFNYYLDEIAKDGKIPPFPEEMTLEDLPETWALDYSDKDLKYYLLEQNAERIYVILYKALLKGKYLSQAAIVPPELLSKPKAKQGLAVVLTLADKAFRMHLMESKTHDMQYMLRKQGSK